MGAASALALLPVTAQPVDAAIGQDHIARKQHPEQRKRHGSGFAKSPLRGWPGSTIAVQVLAVDKLSPSL